MMTFIIAFALLLLIILGMSLGVIMMNKPIKGSCGGLNAIEGTDRCVVCKREIDPDSKLREKFDCPRVNKMS